MADVEVSERIDASPETVWALVSDVPRMGQWSPETTGCRWLDGAAGPEVGARFRGSNRKGFRRWSTTCEVTAAEPGRRFSFDVSSGGLPISTWTYAFTAEGSGTLAVESWTDRRPAWLRVLGVPMMGVADRAAHNRRGMQATLAALKAAAESTSS